MRKPTTEQRSKDRRSSGRDAALDPARLEAFLQLGRQTGKDLIEELVETYRSEGPMYIKAMWQALAEGDARRVAKAAHSLGGGAAYLGASTLTRLCRELETDLNGEDPVDCELRLRAVEEEHRRVLEELDSVQAS